LVKKMANIRFGIESYTVKQIIPCQGNWMAVGKDVDTLRPIRAEILGSSSLLALTGLLQPE
jgi:hypothetical protein